MFSAPPDRGHSPLHLHGGIRHLAWATCRGWQHVLLHVLLAQLLFNVTRHVVCLKCSLHLHLVSQVLDLTHHPDRSVLVSSSATNFMTAELLESSCACVEECSLLASFLIGVSTSTPFRSVVVWKLADDVRRLCPLFLLGEPALPLRVS